MKYEKPVTAIAFTPDMSHFGVGQADGSVVVTKNKEKEKKTEILDDSAFLLNLSTPQQVQDYKYFFRGIYNNKPRRTDQIAETEKQMRLAKYDTLLKQFKYTDALVESLATKNTLVILAVFEELLYRDGLSIALDRLDEKAVVDLLGFIYKKCDSTEHQREVFLLFDHLLNRLDAICQVGVSTHVDQLLADIHHKIATESAVAQNIAELGATIEILEACQ